MAQGLAHGPRPCPRPKAVPTAQGPAHGQSHGLGHGARRRNAEWSEPNRARTRNAERGHTLPIPPRAQINLPPSHYLDRSGDDATNSGVVMRAARAPRLGVKCLGVIFDMFVFVWEGHPSFRPSVRPSFRPGRYVACILLGASHPCKDVCVV